VDHNQLFSDAVDQICTQAKKLLAVCDEANEGNTQWCDDDDMLRNVPASAACLKLAYKLWGETRPPAPNPLNHPMGPYGNPFNNPFNGPGPHGFGPHYKGPCEAPEPAVAEETEIGPMTSSQEILKNLGLPEWSSVGQQLAEAEIEGLLDKARGELHERVDDMDAMMLFNILRSLVEVDKAHDTIKAEREAEMADIEAGCGPCDPGPQGEPGPAGHE